MEVTVFVLCPANLSRMVDEVQDIGKLYKLEEVEAITGIKADTLKKRCQRGNISGVKVPGEGGRMVWALTWDIIQGLRGEKSGYAQLLKEWEDGIRSGYLHPKLRPLSEKR